MSALQNVHVSLTYDESVLLRLAVQKYLGKEVEDANLLNGTETGDLCLKRIGRLTLIDQRILHSQNAA